MKYRRWSTPAARGVQTNTAFLDTITIGTAVGSALVARRFQLRLDRQLARRLHALVIF